MKAFIVKNSRVVSGVMSVAFVLSLFGAAPLAQAASLTSVQIDAITNLLHAFGADQATIANVQAVLEGASASTTTSTTPPNLAGYVVQPPPNCSVLSSGLHIGSTGADVSRLQSFLSKDNAVYPQGLVTGYFGSDTQEALQRWQEMHNIVATGTPQSTGYGAVGPRTRGELNKEMEMECEGGDSGSSTASTTSSGDTGSGAASTTQSGSNSGDN